MTSTSVTPEAAAQSPSEPPRKKQRISSPSTSTSTPMNISLDTPIPAVQPTNEEQNTDKMDENIVDHDAIDAQAQLKRELEVGILHFVNGDISGFKGILKQRYTDFMVNEVQLDGNVVHLTDDKAPKAPVTHVTPKDNPLPEPKATAVDDEVSQFLDTLNNSNVKSEEAEQKPNVSAVALTNNENSNPNGSVDETTISKTTFNVSTEDQELLLSYFGAELKEQLIKFHEKILSKPGAKASVFGSLFSAPITDRPLRGRIHQDIRRIFESRIETEAVAESKIRISAAPKTVAAQHGKNGPPLSSNQTARNNRGPGQVRGKIGFAQLGGEYLHFTLYKENKDTMEVLGFIASRLHIKAKDFSFAGNKDRRAATVQRVSIFRQQANNLAKLNPQLKVGSRIGNFKHEPHGLELGDLRGNQFQITLRDCQFDVDETMTMDLDAKLAFANRSVSQLISEIQKNGFINYFGLQRFGTFGIGTDAVGKLILQDDYKGAVEAILTYNPAALSEDNRSDDRIGRDDFHRAKAIKLFDDGGDMPEILEILPRKFTAEAAIIRVLCRRNHSGNFLGALKEIPRNLRTMYVHAHQSLIWNVVASERWARYGSKVIAGDLVLVKDHPVAPGEIKPEVDESGEIIVLPGSHDIAVQHDDIYERARTLSAEEAESGRYSIFDIVLPLPGFDIEYPANDIGDFYKEFMSSERGGKLDPADMRRKEKDFSLSGSYRKVVGQVGKDISFEVKSYHEETEQLVETDLEKLLKGRPQETPFEPRFQNGFHSNGNNVRGGGQRGRGGFQNRGRGGNSYQADPRSAARDQASAPHHAAGISAWNNFSATVENTERAARIEAEAQAKALPPVDPKNIPLPAISDTYIEAQVGENGRHRVGKNTAIIAAVGGDVEGKEGITDTSFGELDGGVKLEGGNQKPSTISASNPDNDKMDLDAAPVKRTADKISISTSPVSKSGSPPLKATKKEDTEVSELVVVAANEPSPARLAVILKFELSSSQYATMALRELMKAGGVVTYKPDFSSGR